MDFTQDSGEAFFEEAAMGSEALLDEYMDQGSIAEEHLGWYTLVNTCSSHVTLKRQNRRNEVALERVSEPLAVFAAENGKEYPHDRFNYAWKILMQNHPHDSICGCSVDQVNKEIEAGGTGHHAHRQGVLVAGRLPGLPPPLPRHQLAELLLPVSGRGSPLVQRASGS